MKQKKSSCRKFTSIGGQAVIEGIMMRGPKKSALSIRLSNGSILTEEVLVHQLKDKYKFLGWPLIRGIVGLVEAMVTGYKILMRSADLATNEEEEVAPVIEENAEVVATEEVAEGTTNEISVENMETEEPELTLTEKIEEAKATNKFFILISALASVLGIALSFFIFFYVPSFLFNLIKSSVGDGISGYRAVVEGIMKLALFVGYIWVVSFMKEIKRVFQYHGAEHKTIFCYEAGEELTVENVRSKSRFHPRCGTSFMILMIVVGITISTLVINYFPWLTKNILVWVFTKILLIPVFCAFGYEILKICGRYDNIITKIISAPGLWVQRLTTKEPDDGMIEVAITAMKEVIPEKNEDGCIV